MIKGSLLPMKSIFLIIMMVILFSVIAFSVWLFFNINVEINARALDRAAVEIIDALGKSSLTKELAVFDEEELDKYHNTRIEPYIRHCKYGYSIKVKSADKKEWQFGYKPEKPVESNEDSTSKFPVAVVRNSDIKPAELEITVYNTWTSRISCLIEGAYLSKEVTEDMFDCSSDLRDHYQTCGFAIRPKDGKADSDFLCILDKSGKDKDCRYLPGIPVIEQSLFYIGKGDKDVRMLKAVPVKIGLESEAMGKRCDEINLQKVKAGKNEDAIIIMCFEEQWVGAKKNLINPIPNVVCDPASYTPSHRAVDIQADCRTEVKAACGGRLEYVTGVFRGGQAAFIHHDESCNGWSGYRTAYALDSADTRTRDVKQGEVIGTVRKYEGKCQLHFAIIEEGRPLGDGIDASFVCAGR